MKVLFASAALLCVILFAGCSREEPLAPAPAAKSVETAVAQIVNLVVPRGASEVVLKEIDAGALTADDFKELLCDFPADIVTLWMPGETRWLLVGWKGTNLVSLARAMDAVSVDATPTPSVPEVFASYAGTREDILPAFEVELAGTLLPEWFVTREIPEIRWLATEGVEPDILRVTLAEMRSAQIIRRLILEGNMAARQAKDRKSEEAATEKWARAYKRNPRDPMLLERLDRLARNARGFLEVGKVLPAMKCYETILLVRPDDAAAVNNFGVCLKRLGKRKLAEQALKRAKELMK